MTLNRFMIWAVALAASVAAQNTCETVEAQTAIKVLKSFTIDYNKEQSQYWSTFSGDLKPTCILEPETSEEVAAIVSILHKNNETFAIKSGGHNPNNHFASVDGGPLISTKRLNEVIFNADSETVRVGPGNRWDEVGKKLDKTGYTVVGGRIGNVGVGGYLLGSKCTWRTTPETKPLTKYRWTELYEYRVRLGVQLGHRIHGGTGKFLNRHC
ncbi:hypothetical protein PC116_g29623 [Phytophthora cactorum]|nr:hypothetical protein PC116_g29623 [Phytophthora cactorum]